MNLYSRNCPDSYLYGSYLRVSDNYVNDAHELLTDIDEITFSKRNINLFEYVNIIAASLLDKGFYADDLIFVEHIKENPDGIRHS